MKAPHRKVSWLRKLCENLKDAYGLPPCISRDVQYFMLNDPDYSKKIMEAIDKVKTPDEKIKIKYFDEVHEYIVI